MFSRIWDPNSIPCFNDSIANCYPKVLQHLLKKSKSRWFEMMGYPVSFNSKIPCNRCAIKEHHQTCCPGDTLISKLSKEMDAPPLPQNNPTIFQNKENGNNKVNQKDQINLLDLGKKKKKKK